MPAAASPPISWLMTALASMTTKTLVPLCFVLFPGRPHESRSGGSSRHGTTTTDARLYFRERWPVGDPRQIPEDQLGHRDAIRGSADLQRSVEVVGHVAYLDHFHGPHMFECHTHVLKGRT